MRRNSKQRVSQRFSQSQYQSQDISYFDQDTNDANVSNEYGADVKKKRMQNKNKKKKQYVPKCNDLYDLAEQQVVNVRKNGQLVLQHLRPHFLTKWDGEQNQLEIPMEQMSILSPVMKVYWSTKSKNMNSIVLMQMGKVQLIAFEDDAIKMHQIFNKPLQKFSSFLSVSFYPKEMQLVKIELYERRMHLIILGEVEDQQYRDQNGIIKREITEVITPSLFLQRQPSKKFGQRLLLAIFIDGNQCGIACLDPERNQFILQHFKGEKDQLIHQIRRILNKYRPVELLIQRKDQNLKRIAKQICQPFVVEVSTISHELKENIQKMKSISNDPIFKRLQLLYEKEISEDKQFSMSAIVKVLGMVYQYTMNLGLLEKIFGQGLFTFSNFEENKQKPMFDAQVYENLQIFYRRDQPNSFGIQGTLFHTLNHCATLSGHKLLKKWIDDPLKNTQLIQERQNAVKQFLENYDQVDEIRTQLKKFAFLERKVGNIYHWVFTRKDEGKIVLTKNMKFEKNYDPKKNPVVQKLLEIYQVLGLLKQAETFFVELQKYNFQDKLLQNTCSLVELPEDTDLEKIGLNQLELLKGVPSIKNFVQKILVKMKYDEKLQIIEPAQGMNQIFDIEKQEIKRINSLLNQKLDEWKRKLGVSSANFVSTRVRNEMQFPISEVKNHQFKNSLYFSSQTAKSIRYITNETNELTQQLASHEESLSRAYEPFFSMIVKQFCSQKHIWSLYLAKLAKLDVLLSLAKVSHSMPKKCLPKFVESGMMIKNGHHPVLLSSTKFSQNYSNSSQSNPNKKTLIGNSFELRPPQHIMLLTGPNMGGKSTFLRQTCLLAIMAQIGCYIPAQKYQCMIFDQIFCRIGASDRVFEGKSTFYVQLEQTKRIVDQATPSSLVIIDELGRGTSTFDGMAIASSTLKYIIEEIQCCCLFSTHYFPLLQQFKKIPQVFCAKTSYKVKQDEIEYTYQIQQGSAQKSFASQVAFCVGFSNDLINLANAKAKQMEEKEDLKKQLLQMDDFIKQ